MPASLETIQSSLDEIRDIANHALDVAERALSRAHSAQDYAENTEVRCDDNVAEIAYQRGLADTAARRVEDAVLDIQGTNLEQRIEAVLLAKIRDGTFHSVVIDQPEQPEDSEPSLTTASLDTLLQQYVTWNPGGTHPVVQSQSDLSESESEDVAAVATNWVPDEGAGQSEAVSLDEVAYDAYDEYIEGSR